MILSSIYHYTTEDVVWDARRRLLVVGVERLWYDGGVTIRKGTFGAAPLWRVCGDGRGPRDLERRYRYETNETVLIFVDGGGVGDVCPRGLRLGRYSV